MLPISIIRAALKLSICLLQGATVVPLGKAWSELMTRFMVSSSRRAVDQLLAFVGFDLRPPPRTRLVWARLVLNSKPVVVF